MLKLKLNKREELHVPNCHKFYRNLRALLNMVVFLLRSMRPVTAVVINMLNRDMINALPTHDLIGSACSSMKDSWLYDEISKTLSQNCFSCEEALPARL